MDYVQFYDGPLGRMTLASDGAALIGLWFDAQRYDRAGLSEPYLVRSVSALEAAKAWLDVYFSGREPDFSPPLAPRGSPFQRRVWTALLGVPYAQSVTYRALAQRLGHTCPRAVGGAVGRNPLSLIVPCHRVLGADGRLTGYAGGLARKRWLLELERGAPPGPLYHP